jgi:hypothetical protein
MDTYQTIEIEACIFYFDVIGVTKAYLDDPSVLQRLQKFQREVRQTPFPVGIEYSTLITFYDNVWARVNAAEPAVDHLMLSLATDTMKIAEKHGFKNYLGACTKGKHTFDIIDKTLIGSPADIRIQHLDTLSEPHMRAVMVEKWSKHWHKAKRDLCNRPCTWFGEEVINQETLNAYSTGQSLSYVVLGNTVDFSQRPLDKAAWPFSSSSRFTPVAPASK